MRRRWLQLSLASCLVGALAAGACTRSGTQDVVEVVADPALQKLLQHVPADTPYAFVSMGNNPGSRDFMTKMYAPLAPLMAQVEGKFDAIGAEVGDSDRGKLVRAVLGELKGKLSVDGMASLGFDIDARFAVYGLGVLPAFRLELRDPAALQAAIERVQQTSGVRLPTKKLGELEYWHIADDKVEGVVAIVDGYLVAGAAPKAQADRMFALLLGAERPAQHLGNSERFQKLLAEHGLARISAGFIDARTLAEALLGEGDALNRDSVAALAPELAGKWPGLTAECKQEIRSLVALAPRLVFGTEQFDASGFAGKFVVELRPDVAQDLMAMRASVPGLDLESTRSAMFAMGVGFDMDRALAFAQSKAAAIATAPYTCEHLAEINRVAGSLGGEIKQLPPETWKARGFTAVVDEFKLAGALPSEIRGYLTVAFTDTQALLKPLAVMPGFADIKDDGSVIAIPDGTIPFLNGLSFSAQAGQAAAIAVGPDSAARVKTLLAAPANADPPLMVMVYDMARFGELMSKLLGATASDTPEMKLLTDFYKATGTVVYDVRATERGVVANTRMNLP